MEKSDDEPLNEKYEKSRSRSKHCHLLVLSIVFFILCLAGIISAVVYVISRIHSPNNPSPAGPCTDPCVYVPNKFIYLLSLDKAVLSSMRPLTLKDPKIRQLK